MADEMSNPGAKRKLATVEQLAPQVGFETRQEPIIFEVVMAGPFSSELTNIGRP
jgi:hypothetical protein